MDTQNQSQASKDLSLTALLAIVILIALIVVFITTVNFLKSNAYNTVKQIQLGIETTESIDGTDLDITSPINAIDIDDYYNSLSKRLQMVDDYADFGPESVSDQTLGL